MSILKELLTLHEAAPVSLEKVAAKAYRAGAHPSEKEFAKHLFDKHWGKTTLYWHGDRFFENDELGAAYEKAEKAAVEVINDGYNADVNMEIDASALGDGGEDAPGMADFEWQAEFGDSQGGERQECYLGYDPVHDKLYIGFDAWISDENFNNDFDAAFEKAAGVDYDADIEEHHAVLDAAWEEYQKQYAQWGLVFEITNHNGVYSAEEAFPPMPGGFYRGMFKTFKQHRSPAIIDLRLD